MCDGAFIHWYPIKISKEIIQLKYSVQQLPNVLSIVLWKRIYGFWNKTHECNLNLLKMHNLLELPVDCEADLECSLKYGIIKQEN